MAAPQRTREPSPAWQQLEMKLTCPKQHVYELIRPVVLFDQPVAERAAETATAERTLYRHVQTFRQHGLGATQRPATAPIRAAARLPAEAIAYLLAIKAEYPPMRHYELATICLVRFGRRPSIKTVKRALATNSLPMLTTRRFPPYLTSPDIVERRRAILRLITEGWTKKSIAGYLGISRKTVHGVLKRWDTEGLAGLKRRSSAPHRHGRRLASMVQHHVRRLQRNPLLGAWRLHAALRREGIHVSPRTCGRLMAINREVFPELRPPEPPPKKDPQPMPFAAQYRHQSPRGYPDD